MMRLNEEPAPPAGASDAEVVSKCRNQAGVEQERRPNDLGERHAIGGRPLSEGSDELGEPLSLARRRQQWCAPLDHVTEQVFPFGLQKHNRSADIWRAAAAALGRSCYRGGGPVKDELSCGYGAQDRCALPVAKAPARRSAATDSSTPTIVDIIVADITVVGVTMVDITIVDIIVADITVVGVTMAGEPLDFKTGRG
jgi:hypothetical protein